MDNPVKKLRGGVVELCTTGDGSIINCAEGK